MAMEAVDKRLVRREHRLIQLLDPPFRQITFESRLYKGVRPRRQGRMADNTLMQRYGQRWHSLHWATAGAWELFSIINPVNHGRSPEEIETYKVEPYVVAADVYAVQPHSGRGGWTWYTGSAGWMYRLIVESLLGLRLEADKLRFEPCLPAEWEMFKVHYRYRETIYHITVRQTAPMG